MAKLLTAKSLFSNMACCAVVKFSVFSCRVLIYSQIGTLDNSRVQIRSSGDTEHVLSDCCVHVRRYLCSAGINLVCVAPRHHLLFDFLTETDRLALAALPSPLELRKTKYCKKKTAHGNT